MELEDDKRECDSTSLNLWQRAIVKQRSATKKKSELLHLFHAQRIQF